MPVNVNGSHRHTLQGKRKPCSLQNFSLEQTTKTSCKLQVYCDKSTPLAIRCILIAMQRPNMPLKSICKNFKIFFQLSNYIGLERCQCGLQSLADMHKHLFLSTQPTSHLFLLIKPDYSVACNSCETHKSAHSSCVSRLSTWRKRQNCRTLRKSPSLRNQGNKTDQHLSNNV